MADPVRARLWRSGGRWYARVLDAPMYVEVTGTSRIGCLDELRDAIGDDVVLTVEVVPELVGVSEASDIMGWDKRRVITYIDRGHFPEPIAALAGGRIWLREEIEAYAEDWRARHPDTLAR
jgi:predicted DNA-binding transcriptional regulator AlpA